MGITKIVNVHKKINKCKIKKCLIRCLSLLKYACVLICFQNIAQTLFTYYIYTCLFCNEENNKN